jgi:DNA-binding MarR family transcriptional regulator
MRNVMNMQTNEADLSCINLQMLRASHRVMKVYEDAYRPYGIKATQLPVLNLIEQFQSMTTREIAEQTESERSVLSRKLAVMEKNNWIQAATDGQTREKVFQLTEEGKRLLDELRPVRIKVQEKLLAQLDENEINLLMNLCDKFHEI